MLLMSGDPPLQLKILNGNPVLIRLLLITCKPLSIEYVSCEMASLDSEE